MRDTGECTVFEERGREGKEGGKGEGWERGRKGGRQRRSDRRGIRCIYTLTLHMMRTWLYYTRHRPHTTAEKVGTGVVSYLQQKGLGMRLGQEALHIS